MIKKGLLIVISGPSGAGKGTVVNEIKKDAEYSLSVSATTRSPRTGEQDGVHYFFKTIEQFEEMIKNKELLEYAQFCENYYGTPISYVNKRLDEGLNVILEIEVQGALQVKEIYPEAVLVFLVPPSLDELERRLRGRGTETDDKISMRLKRAKEEFELMDKYDYIVVNNEVDTAVCDIKTIVKAEKMRSLRSIELKEFFKGEEA